MLLGCLSNWPEDLVRTGDMRDVDMDDTPPPRLRWRNHPDKERQQHTYHHADLPLANVLTDFGWYVSAW